MEETLKVTLVQSHLSWENPVVNRNHFSEILNSIKEETHLIVLPEMFTTGFTMNAEAVAEEKEGPTFLWMQAQAKKKHSAITGSVIIKENGLYYNRLFFVFPDGSFKTYNKKHTFTLAGEHEVYTAGKNHTILNYRGWKICPLICYDLRFPVWARNVHDYDLLLYVANWPKKRVSAWDALLKARAIENMSYTIGVNRIGLDDTGHEYTGHSGAYDVLGEHLSTHDFQKQFVETISLSKSHIHKNRKHLQFLNDRDEFTLV